MSVIAENINRLRDRIEATCARVGRRPDEILIVGVTKTVGPERVQEAADAGLRVFGENRVQEAAGKIGRVTGDVSWHMIGHLQRNKVRKAVGMFDMIQSVDSYDVAAEIGSRSEQAGRKMDVLVEVKTSGEETKYGIAPERAVDLVEQMSHLSDINVKGLMTIGTFTDDEGLVRHCFRTLREVSETIGVAGIPRVEMRYLSMGMTSDFELAIEEGSNMLRVGTAIFGPR
jgi:pyridoxal phosphate enzyme (YggS family)